MPGGCGGEPPSPPTSLAETAPAPLRTPPAMLPTVINPKKLQARIVAVYLGLLVVIQAASYWFIQDSVDRNARASIRTELNTGERVFLRLLQQNTYNLEQATPALSAHYRFPPPPFTPH